MRLCRISRQISIILRKEANALARAEVLAKKQQAKARNAARKLAKVEITPIPALVAPEPTSFGRQRKTPAKLAL